MTLKYFHSTLCQENFENFRLSLFPFSHRLKEHFNFLFLALECCEVFSAEECRNRCASLLKRPTYSTGEKLEDIKACRRHSSKHDEDYAVIIYQSFKVKSQKQVS